MTIRVLILMSCLAVSTAHAADRECWALGEIEVTTYDNAAWTVVGSKYTLATGLGSATLGADRQAANLERGTERTTRVAWTKPPARWCSDDPVELAATAVGNFGGFLYDSVPVGSIVPADVPTPPVPLAACGKAPSPWSPGA